MCTPATASPSRAPRVCARSEACGGGILVENATTGWSSGCGGTMTRIGRLCSEAVDAPCLTTASVKSTFACSSVPLSNPARGGRTLCSSMLYAVVTPRCSVCTAVHHWLCPASGGGESHNLVPTVHGVVRRIAKGEEGRKGAPSSLLARFARTRARSRAFSVWMKCWSTHVPTSPTTVNDSPLFATIVPRAFSCARTHSLCSLGTTRMRACWSPAGTTRGRPSASLTSSRGGHSRQKGGAAPKISFAAAAIPARCGEHALCPPASRTRAAYVLLVSPSPSRATGSDMLCRRRDESVAWSVFTSSSSRCSANMRPKGLPSR